MFGKSRSEAVAVGTTAVCSHVRARSRIELRIPLGAGAGGIQFDWGARGGCFDLGYLGRGHEEAVLLDKGAKSVRQHERFAE